MKTAFLGVGNMASAVILANGGKNIEWQNIFLFDIAKEKCLPFEEKGAVCFSSVKEVVENAECVFLSVKPQDYFSLLEEVRTAVGFEKKLYISIGAGISSESVSSFLSGADVVRALPNTPMLIGKGVSAVCKNDTVSKEHFNFACSLFENAGSVLIIDEAEMNRIIGVTSSSPAYVFKFIQAIADGASAQGLDGNSMISEICDVLIGSAYLLKQSGKSTEAMISMVASKGGTTERAISSLDEHNFGSIISEAMIACTDRAEELGKNK